MIAKDGGSPFLGTESPKVNDVNTFSRTSNASYNHERVSNSVKYSQYGQDGGSPVVENRLLNAEKYMCGDGQ